MSRSRKGGSRGGYGGGRSRGGRGGGGGRFGQFVFAIFVLSAIVAVYQIPYDPGVKGIVNIAKSKAENAGAWAEGVAPSIEEWVGGILRGGREAPTGIDIPYGDKYEESSGGGGNDVGSYDNPGGNTTEGETYGSSGEAVAGAIKIVDQLKVAEAENVSYKRDKWKHWSSVRSCLDTRQAVLIRDAVEGSVVMKDKKGKETTDTSVGCTVVSGKWLDPYSGKEFTNPKDLDIDHFIPLKYAATHNGQGFSEEKKEQFANDMKSNPYHLVAVSASENRKKSDKGPGSYLPPNESFHCTYAVTWVDISKNYDLSISSKDKETITKILSTC